MNRTATQSTRRVSPLLKWAGGKSRLLAQLSALMPSDVRPGFAGRLVEPFVGGAAMFLWMRPRLGLLSDSNPEVINLYEVTRDRPSELVRALDRYQALPHEADVYYAQRAQRPGDAVERAARMIYLNRNCFNGLYRLNRSGAFNVPFGRYGSKPKLYDADNLASVSERLQAAELRAASFEEVLLDVEPGDFVYLDPPYYPLTSTSSFTAYTATAFGHREQVRLRDSILEVHRRTAGRARVMMSNSSAPALLELYAPYADVLRVHEVDVRRSVGADSKSRGMIKEVAIVNY